MKILDEHLSVRETEKLVKKILSGKPEKAETKEKPADDFIYRDLEEKIKTAIGTKVTIDRKKNGKGKISIEYYSKEELERISELLMGN
jgi:ParB family chromosome partitioning protein